MGRDKARLSIGGELLVERIARQVERAAGSVAIVGDPARFADLQRTIIADRVEGAGPLAGIEAVLQHTRAECNLIVACDMPGLDAAVLQNLLERAEETPGADAVLAESDGQPHPLCGVYRARCRETVERALRAGERKILRALDGLRVIRLTVPAGSMINVNTPAEWAAVARE